MSPLRRAGRRLLHPGVLTPLVLILVLGLLWMATLTLIRAERTGARAAAVGLARETSRTYEAQVVRVVREIDQALKVVKLAVERDGGRVDLAELKDRGLLPPDLLFVVAVADREGAIVSSTRPLGSATIAGRPYFEQQRDGDVLAAGTPEPDQDGEPRLPFTRRIIGADGGFAGVALILVDASFFVSGYEPAVFGARGVLGLVGTDGVVRVRRSGDTVTYGEAAELPPASDADEPPVLLGASAWDGVRRYTSARRLYDAPLAVVVGLAEDEQLAATEHNARVYEARAAGVSVALVLVGTLLGWLSWQLAESRRRSLEAEKAHAKQVEYLAFHDGLTGLPNRSLFSKLLHQGLQQARRHQRSLAVLFVDLDRFKYINDTLGHEAGDQLLQEMATRLRSCVRESDTVARLGGDEFVLLLAELADGSYAGAVAQKIIAGIAKPFQLLGQDFRVTGSVGIATFPQDGLDEETLTKNADTAMYKAKESGKNNYQFYSAQMNVESLERLALEASLRHALERNELELFYQAKRDLKTGDITGMEALLRWQHPDLGTIAPLRFLPVAEQSGLIIPIGRWVLKSACAQNVEWQRQGLPRLCMAVNLTHRQFADPQLLGDVAAILAETTMDPGLLELEITESMLMQDVTRTLRVLGGLKQLGVRIAVDDFGMGYSTLATLQQFPLDTIKIDRSFVRGVAEGDEGRSFTEAVIAMGKSLSLTVVAQGVETKAQADFLRQHACDELQGFYFNRPVPAAQFQTVLVAQHHAPEVADLSNHRAKRAGGTS